MLLPAWLYWYIAVSVVTILFADITRRILNYRYSVSQQTAMLELTPPASSEKPPLATEQLFTMLHHTGARASWKNRLLGRYSHYSFEIVSSRQDGIRYLVRLPAEDVPVFEQQLAAYLHGSQFKRVEDYLLTTEGSSLRLVEYKQARHFAYPLASHDLLAQHDPVDYITGSMTKLAPGELVALQIVLTATNPKEVTRIRNKLILGQDANLYRKSRSLWLRTILFIIGLPILVLKGVFAMITGLTAPTYSSSPKYAYQPPPQKAYAPTPASQAINASLNDKLAQPLFQTSIRAVVCTQDNAKASQILSSLKAALASFHVPGYQWFVVKRTWPQKFRLKYRWTHYFYRLPGEFARTDNVLSVAEVASLYHFPYGEGAENVATISSRTLPAPAALKALTDRDEFDVILGENTHHGLVTPIGLTAAERERHVYVIGGTGNGKTTMLQYAIVQDIKNGKGVAVVDPHGDLAETILQHIPEDRVNDVVYFNPSDIDHPIALNLLELPEGLSDSQMALEQDFVTEAIVSLFRKTFSEDDSGGHRIEYILRNTIRTAYTVPGATLFTLYDLLTDTNYRNSITQKLTDRRLKQFWHNEFAKAGNMQRVKMTSGVTTKLGRYDSSAVVRGVIEQTISTIDFDDILASGKILICNFAKGSIGEDTAELFGTAVLTKLQLAALRRVRLSQSDRHPYFLYVDEFQHFATHSFLQMLSEARKYKLFLTMAEQSTAQQEEQRLVHIILDNVGTVVCFRVRAASEKLLLPIFQPKIETGEIASLSAYHYYVKIAGMETHDPLSGETVVLAEPSNPKIAQKVIAASRRQYTTRVVASGQKKQRSENIETKTKNEDEDDDVGFEQEQQPVLGN